MSEDPSPAVEAWLDEFIEHLSGEREQPPSLEDIEPDERGHARALAFTVSELWGWRAPARKEMSSEAAVALGLDQLDHDVAIEGAQLRAARLGAGLQVSTLARQLSELGWSVSAAEIGELETGKRLEIPGDAVALLVMLLGLSPSVLMSMGVTDVEAVLSTPRVRQTIEAAAVRLNRTVEEVAIFLRPRLIGAQFRQHDSREDDLIELVERILAGLDPL